MIIGIGGVSRSGKSNLALQIRNLFLHHGKNVQIISQDDYVHPEEKIPLIHGRVDWECPESIDFQKLREAVMDASRLFDHVIIEGLFAYSDPETNGLYDIQFFMEISRPVFLKRKSVDHRWGNEPSWYIDHIWESYLKYGSTWRDNSNCIVLSGETPVRIKLLENYLLPEAN
jgi:uridine kinase